MISLGSPKVNFQYENPDGFARLLTAVETHVKDDDFDGETESRSSTPGGSDSKQLAFQVRSSCALKLFILLTRIFGCNNNNNNSNKIL